MPQNDTWGSDMSQKSRTDRSKKIKKQNLAKYGPKKFKKAKFSNDEKGQIKNITKTYQINFGIS
jgi:hypothetical protein